MKRTGTFYSLTSFPSGIKTPSSETRRRQREDFPSESVIRNLLNYSKALAVLKTNQTGYINLVMN